MMGDRPHILFICTDQQRADCLGAAGHPLIATPNMDRLAREGARFSHCCTTSPLCVPARISMTTGLYPHNNNLWLGDNAVASDADTYLHRLRRAGYRTAGIGKHHLYWMENCDLYANEPSYQAIGFDHVEDMSGTWGIIEGTSIYTDYLAERSLLEPVRAYLKQLEEQPDEVRRFVAEPLPFPGANDPAEHYIDAFVGRRVEAYVEKYESAQPSFVYVGFQGPHEPWDAPDRYADLYDLEAIPEPIPEHPAGDWLPQRSRDYYTFAQYYQPPSPRALKQITARYWGKIAQIDDAIGGILSAYERKGWLDDTAIVFASDHGEMLGDHGRLSKSVFYESALRVPLIVRVPTAARPGAGRTVDALVETIDIHATLLDLAGAEPWQHQDSLSLMPLVQGEATHLRGNALSEVHAQYMLRTPDWKIVVGRNGLTLQLFDLCGDPLEQCNLCGHPDHGDRELQLRSELLARIAGSTFRDSEIDPEYCDHAFPIEG